jgi:hypothetical protein
MALLYNKGKKDWELKKGFPKLCRGKSLTMPDEEALKWVRLYPREFEIMTSDNKQTVKQQVEKTEKLNSQEAALNEREKALNEKEVVLNEKEKSLNEREAALNEKEASLNENPVKVKRTRKPKEE